MNHLDQVLQGYIDELSYNTEIIIAQFSFSPNKGSATLKYNEISFEPLWLEVNKAHQEITKDERVVSSSRSIKFDRKEITLMVYAKGDPKLTSYSIAILKEHSNVRAVERSLELLAQKCVSETYSLKWK